MNEQPMTIRLSRNDFETMLREARMQAPQEACGLLAGTDENGVRVIHRIYVLENVEHSAQHFSLRPEDQLAAIRNMRQNGPQLLGNWHSHPATPSRPSEEDIRLAFDKTATYCILSLAGETPVLNAFHIESGTVRKENLIIQE